jgi:hypothetical protein
MNDFHLMNFANEKAAQRRAEADRYRLALGSRGQQAHPRRQGGSRRQAERGSLSSLFHRLAFR